VNNGLLRLSFSVCLSALALSPATRAQTLDEQYEYYLETASPPGTFNDHKCLRLAFQRIPGTQDIVPGQAGPNLFAQCDDFPFQNQGSSSAVSSGGGSGAAMSRSSRTNDAALRRRRENARTEQSNASLPQHVNGGAASSDIDSPLFENGSVFMSYDYRNEEQDVTRYEDGRDSDRQTLLLGADYRFSDALVAGAAIGFDELTGDFAGGGEFETAGYNVALYVSWQAIDRLFVDVSASFDFKDVESTRIVGRRIAFIPLGQTEPLIFYNPAYTPVDGETDSKAFAADILSGYDFSLGRFVFGPRVGASILNTSIDDYIETGSSPMTLAFDEQTDESLQSSAGLQASAAFTVGGVVIVPQVNVDWLHEFSSDQRVITVRFAEDLRTNPVKFGFLNQPPDRDVYTARIGAVAVFKHGLSAFVSAEKLFAHDYREQFGVSAGVRWEM